MTLPKHTDPAVRQMIYEAGAPIRKLFDAPRPEGTDEGVAKGEGINQLKARVVAVSEKPESKK